MNSNNSENGMLTDTKQKEQCDFEINTEHPADDCSGKLEECLQSNECKNHQSGNFQDALCLLNVKAIVNKIETQSNRCTSCENLNRRSIAVEREVGVRDIIRQLESFAGPHPKWRTLQIIQNSNECSDALQYNKRNSSASLIDSGTGDSGLPCPEQDNDTADDKDDNDDKDNDKKDLAEDCDDSSSDSDLDKTPTNEDMANSLQDSGFGVLEENVQQNNLTEEKDDKILDSKSPERAPPLGEVLQSSDASDDVFSFTEDVEQRLNTVIFRLKSESDIQDSEAEELEDDTTDLEPEKEAGSDTKKIFERRRFWHEETSKKSALQ